MTLYGRFMPMIGLLVLVAVAGPAVAQSFNCRGATFPDELTICQDPQLLLDTPLAMLRGHL